MAGSRISGRRSVYGGAGTCIGMGAGRHKSHGRRGRRHSSSGAQAAKKAGGIQASRPYVTQQASGTGQAEESRQIHEVIQSCPKPINQVKMYPAVVDPGNRR